jgi:hypothetical protein
MGNLHYIGINQKTEVDNKEQIRTQTGEMDNFVYAEPLKNEERQE